MRGFFISFVALLSLSWLTTTAQAAQAYYVSFDGLSLNFTEAIAFCASQTDVNGTVGKVATTRTKALVQAVQQLMIPKSSSIKYWLGAKSAQSRGVYKWIDDNSPVQYSNFDLGYEGEIGEVQPGCLMLQSLGYWKPEDCSVTHQVLCEFDSTFVPRTSYGRYEVYVGLFDTYKRAEEACKAETHNGKQGRLATFRNADEYALAKAAYNQGRTFVDAWIGGRRRANGTSAAVIWTDNNQSLPAFGFASYNGGLGVDTSRGPADCVAFGGFNIDDVYAVFVSCFNAPTTQALCEFSDIPALVQKQRYVAYVGLAYASQRPWSRTDADALCQSESQDGTTGKLATIKSSSDMDAVKSVVADFEGPEDILKLNFGLWIDGKRLTRTGPFVWSDGTNVPLKTVGLTTADITASSFDSGENCLYIWSFGDSAFIIDCTDTETPAVLCEFSFPGSPSGAEPFWETWKTAAVAAGGGAAILIALLLLIRLTCCAKKPSTNASRAGGTKQMVLKTEPPI